ncbi:hypothetical protein B7P43_G02540 [Cryptotermes secundus]|uniref:Cadherin domain-containing protein n=1 Tax=Cryptotermes secundus TaxID=105785 RepID=A0A2J7QNQ7_9NEOP|nr:hypothetical protein B7P43_G02540 [Cryptotermes secundus]
MMSLVLLLLLLATVTAGNYPVLDVSTSMRMLLVPLDAKVGSAIYRLRGTDSDFDFPLQFDIVGARTEPLVHIENLPCSRNHSFCEANVLLARPLELGRVYDLKLRLRDTRGDTTSVRCTIRATNSSTPMDTIFPHLPSLVVVPEDTKIGTELDYVITRKNPKNTRHAGLELRGSSNFAIRQSLASADTVNGTIILTSELDFEQQTMYMLSVFAVDAYAEPDLDTRNLVGFMLAIAVQDVQDMPPMFTSVPPVTVLNNTIQKGDVFLTVHAEDSDKGSPREVRYGIVSEGNPLTPFFNIDQKTGNLSLTKSLKELRKITQPMQPILLTIMAEEVKTGVDEPFAMSSTVQIALIMAEPDNTPPYFDSDKYVAWMDENSPQGNALIFNDPYIAEIRDDDLGKNGVFSISLRNNNGTFEVSPTVGETRVNFVIRVRNNSLLDYEQRHFLVFTIEAREVGPKASMSSSADITVYLRDQNDNPPVFRERVYRADLTENATAGTKVIQVAADDIDEGVNGEVAYTNIMRDNNSLQIDNKSGWITVKTNRHIFDRESAKEFQLYVVAADRNGQGNSATATLLITVFDVNDHTPMFMRSDYEFVLGKDLRSLTSPAVIKALDGDAEAPNNEVQYEIVSGNRNEMFHINIRTGVLTVTNTEVSSKIREEGRIQKFNLLVRAYDLGVPYRSNTVPVLIYPPEPNARNMTFILNGYPVDPKETEEILSKVTGGRVKIQDVRPLPLRRIRSDDSGRSSDDKSVVSARVLYDDNPTVDLTQFQSALRGNRSMDVVKEKETVEVYRRAESALFWILMFLAILIVIIILLLLLCCICPGCPLYAKPNRRGGTSKRSLECRSASAEASVLAVQQTECTQ